MRTSAPRLRPLVLSAALAVAAAAPAAAAKESPGKRALWTELDRSRVRPIQIPSVAPLVERVEPASLVVITEGQSRDVEGLPPGHPPLFGGPEGPMEGQGSGFLIHPSGYALTNHHVIENATSIRVRVGLSRVEVPARVIGTDAKTDVALIKLEGEGREWPVIPLGDSDALKVGDFVVAIGNPFGLEQTVSMGILSARGRRDINPSGRMGLYDFLQTDASINFGNSGGPLLNLHGEVVGMNTAINAAAQGIGFAIPINMIKRMLPSLEQHGRIVRAWIGVGIQPVSAELARGFGMERPQGALVRQVLENGPAAKAGIEAGDVILTFGDHPIVDANELPLIAGDAGVGEKVKLKVLRDGKPRDMTIILGEHPENMSADEAASLQKPKGHAERPSGRGLGVSVVTLDSDDRLRLGLGTKASGARVVKVEFGSPAFHAGLQADDVIAKVNDRDVKDAKELQEIVGKAKSGEVLRLFVKRGESTVFMALKKP